MTGRHGLRRFTNPENERSWIFVRLSGYGRISENIAYTAGFRSAIRRDFGRLRPDFVRLSGRISFGYPAGFRAATAGFRSAIRLDFGWLRPEKHQQNHTKTRQKPDKTTQKPDKSLTKPDKTIQKTNKQHNQRRKTEPIRPDFVRLSGQISGGYGRISFGYPAGFRVATAGKTPAKPNKKQTTT